MTTSPPSRIHWSLTVVMALIAALLASSVSLAAAQSPAIPDGAPVDIHSGTCGDFIDEPAFDAGEIDGTTTDDIWNEEQLQSGIFEDQQLEASGIDFNGDGALQPNEVITPDGVSADMGRAQADLGEALNTDEPHVVVVHASPDAYSTIIACGSVQSAQGGVIQLQPTQNSNLFGFAVLGEDNSQLTTYLFQPNQAPLGTPIPIEEQANLTGHPIDIHDGTCNDFTTEPIYDLGEFQQTNEYAPGEQEPGDMAGEVQPEAEQLGPVYKANTQDVDLGDQDLLGSGLYVVAVHQSADDYGTIIACGQVLPVMEGDDIVVFLHPVSGSNQTGYVRVNQDDSTVRGYLWQIQNYVPAPEATPTPGPSPAPAPTPTPEPTPTQVATAVIVETRVVNAATATAMAQGDVPASPNATEPVAVEIGGDSATAVTASVNQSLALANASENERTFTVEDLQLEATVGGGQQTQLLIPENAEPGTYTYQVLEGDTVVYEGEMTVQ